MQKTPRKLARRLEESSENLTKMAQRKERVGQVSATWPTDHGETQLWKGHMVSL